MRVGSWLAIYFVVWWVCLFMVLPIGVRSQIEAGEVIPGSEPGAPAKPRWAMILSVTTTFALLVTGALWWLVNNYWIV